MVDMGFPLFLLFSLPVLLPGTVLPSTMCTGSTTVLVQVLVQVKNQDHTRVYINYLFVHCFYLLLLICSSYFC
jgi:hypothetical protein